MEMLVKAEDQLLIFPMNEAQISGRKHGMRQRPIAQRRLKAIVINVWKFAVRTNPSGPG
jgi:hypothetical protein